MKWVSALAVLYCLAVPVTCQPTPDAEAVFAAVRGKNAYALSVSLERNVDLSRRDASGQTPLHCAVTEEYPAGVALLLDAGAPVASRDAAGATPLEIAVRKRNIPIIGLLLKAGATADEGADRLARGNRDVDQEILTLLGLPDNADTVIPSNVPYTKTVYVRESLSLTDYERMKREIIEEFTTLLEREPNRGAAGILRLRDLIREEDGRE